jgi:hypothetical protein
LYAPFPLEKALPGAFDINFNRSQQDETISAKVYPDRRGAGYGLSRFDDDLRFDFTKVEAEDDVHFAHRQGFIAKTTAIDPARLKELLGQSLETSPA